MSTSHASVTEFARDRLGHDPQAEAGFSRVDLVTLIATLTLLGLLLAPALARTQLTDRAFQCRNNLGRLLNAWRMYAEDNSDKVPSAWANPGDWWPGGYMSWTGSAAADGANQNNWNPEITIKRSPLWLYCGGNQDIWRCPSDSIYSCLANGQSLPRVRSYSMNAWFNGADAQQIGGSGFTVYAKVGDCLKPGPAMTFVFAHERVDSINDGELIVSMTGYPDQPGTWRLVDFPASQHDGACGFSFVDGHSEMKRWLDRRTMPPIGQGLMLNVPVPNNPDAYWLMDHCTRKP
jgi:prepilin-type processing-associated H-X9-DG protein